MREKGGAGVGKDRSLQHRELSFSGKMDSFVDSHFTDFFFFYLITGGIRVIYTLIISQQHCDFHLFICKQSQF